MTSPIHLQKFSYFLSQNDVFSDLNNPCSQENLTRVVNKLVSDVLIDWGSSYADLFASEE